MSNSRFIDGQHRLLAAQELGVDIYYTVEKNLTCSDIITLNNVKGWGMYDYLNFYVQNQFDEYIKLNEFMKKHGLNLKVAFNMTSGTAKEGFANFRLGKYKFTTDIYQVELDNCWQTIDFIRRMNGFSSYLTSSKFWNALLKLVKSPGFNDKKWMTNLSQMVEKVTQKPTAKDYCRLLMEIHNYRSQTKIDLMED